VYDYYPEQCDPTLTALRKKAYETFAKFRINSSARYAAGGSGGGVDMTSEACLINRK